jgi:hypothetical protein
MKQDLDKLIATGFIVPIEETSWLSQIIVVPKKTRSYAFVWISKS